MKAKEIAHPGTKDDIEETHSSCGSDVNLEGGMMLSMYSISSVSSCLSTVNLHVPLGYRASEREFD